MSTQMFRKKLFQWSQPSIPLYLSIGGTWGEQLSTSGGRRIYSKHDINNYFTRSRLWKKTADWKLISRFCNIAIKEAPLLNAFHVLAWFLLFGFHLPLWNAITVSCFALKCQLNKCNVKVQNLINRSIFWISVEVADNTNLTLARWIFST